MLNNYRSFYTPTNRMFSGGILESACPSVCWSMCPSMYKILVIFVANSSYSFASVVLKLLTYIDHILKVCKMKFLSVNFSWLKNYLLLNLENFLEIACFCQSGGRGSVTPLVLSYYTMQSF